MARGNSYCCLVCKAIYSKEIKVEKVDALFLLRILLEIPQEDELIKSVDFVQVCEHCENLVKDCKQIYAKICEEIERFWECQNKILEKISSTSELEHKSEKKIDVKIGQWVDQCRNFVKDHDFTGFGYPFVVHDFEALIPPADPLLLDPLTEQGEIIVKEELECEQDDNYDDHDNDYVFSQSSEEDNDNDSDYEPSPSKKRKTKQSRKIPDDYEDPEDKKEKIVKLKKNSESNPNNHQETHNEDSSNSGCQDEDFDDNYKRDPKTKKFHCSWPECTKEFKEKKTIIWHMDKHRGTPRRKCDKCDLAFFTMPQLNRHQDLEHGNGVKYKCKICGEEFAYRAKLHSHRTIKHSTNVTFNKPVVCEICGKKVSLTNLEKHKKRLHSGGLEKRFCCDLCPSVFEKGIGLKMHLWRVHDFCESEEIKKQLININKRRREKEKRLQCEVQGCRNYFVTEEGLKCHMDKIHKEDEGRYKCEICGRGYHKMARLKDHLERHEKEVGKREMNWVCVICGWCHGSSKGLEGHMEKVHKGEEVKPRPFKCDLCTKRFVSKAYVNHHRKHVHKMRQEQD